MNILHPRFSLTNQRQFKILKTIFDKIIYYFLKDYFASKIYADKPETIKYLEDNIRRAITEI